MPQPPRRLTIVLVAYLVLVGYALVSWLPTVVAQYEKLAEDHPNWSYVYVGLVGLGAAILAGVSLWILARVVRNTWRKNRQHERRLQNPSEMSAQQKQAEIDENLLAGRDFAGQTEASTEFREEIERSVKEFEEKRSASELEIVAFGTISSGKSSLLNALAGREVFAADVVGGTTSTRSEIPWPGSDKVVLVDTPGLAEVRGESRATQSAAAAQDADLVLLVVDGPLKVYEVDLAKRLLAMEKRIVVCLNKEDWYQAEDQQQLVSQIATQLPNIEVQDVVTIRAAAVSRTRIRVAADGSEIEEKRELSPDVEALAKRLMEIVSRDGKELLLANLLLRSRGLVDEAKARVRAALDKRAEQIIATHMWAAGGAAGVNPIPILDLAGGSAISAKMVLELAQLYKQPIDADTVVKLLEQLTKNLIAMVGATAASPAVGSALASMLKTVPGIGTIAGGLVQGIVQALVTRWIGNVFVKYFQAEMKPPPGGLAELAREQWAQVTAADSLRKLIQAGRRELTDSGLSEATDV